MKVVSVVVFVVVLLCSFVNADDVILPPFSPSPDDLLQIGVVVIHDVGFYDFSYIALIQYFQIQFHNEHISGWICVSDFKGNLTTKETGQVIQKCQNELLAAGMPPETELILAGHGWGGFATQAYLQSTDSALNWQPSGHVLFGSYLQRDYDFMNAFPYPTLTFGGELDGVFRITRTMEAQYDTSQGDYKFMVAVIEGLNHLGYLNITMTQIPEFYLQNDLKSEIDPVDGYQQISQIFVDWVASLYDFQDPNINKRLAQVCQDTSSFLAPLTNAFTKEGYYFFVPPCDGPYSLTTGKKEEKEKEREEAQETCVKSCPTTPYAQVQICDLDGTNVDVFDEFHDVSQFYPVDYLPSIENTCDSPGPSCTLNVSTVSENFYYEDTVYNPVSAYEIAAKMKSRQACWAAAGINHPKYSMDSESLCASFNSQLYKETLITMGTNTMKRFDQYGVGMVMTNDTVVTAFPSWSKTPMGYTVSKDKNGDEVLEVTAIALTTSTTNLASPGYHFCSLLSPGRVAEWVYVDSLRSQYSLGTN